MDFLLFEIFLNIFYFNPAHSTPIRTVGIINFNPISKSTAKNLLLIN